MGRSLTRTSLVSSIARRLWSALQVGAGRTRSRLGRSLDRPPAWEADVLDDVAFNRPWNLVVKLLRTWALLQRRGLRRGETIIIVNWNTLPVLQDTLYAVRSLTAKDVEVLVVDNGSTDGSRQWLGRQNDLRLVRLPVNAGHAIALDIALLLTRTDVAITLDSDAVPLTPGWLNAVIEPIRSPGVVLAGLRSSRDFVHPVFSAVDVRTFIDRRLSFQVHREPEADTGSVVWGVNKWDTGELMTSRLSDDEIVLVDPTENPVAGLPGMTTGGVVYHHGGVTRATEDHPGDRVDDSYLAWRAALEAVLPPTALRPLPGPR